MRYRTLGSSGLLVCVVGLGCNNFGRRIDVAQGRGVVDAALDAAGQWQPSAEDLAEIDAIVPPPGRE
jgi:aryl-alcohol dehydrogenase-like predicted oxidoreductase